jgi:ABC-type phosphate/phosphonate transport system substrate-binding protein
MLVNARMYSVTPAVKDAWKRLFAWVLARAELDWQIVDYDAPAPLAELWARQDLGAVMMCGLPYSQRRPRPILVAAPVPSPDRYSDQAIYFTDLVARADAPYRTLEDTFRGVVGYTLSDSMSGCVALRAHLAPYRAKYGPNLYSKAVGGLVNPRGVIEALTAGRIDVGPLDSYFHDLLRRNEPQTAAKMKVLATTRAAPIPPLVATAPVSAVELERLRGALLAVRTAREVEAERETLVLAGFAVHEPSRYDVFDRIQEEAQGSNW